MAIRQRIIDCFDGEYYFLSNFYNANVEYEGLIYKNSEAAFQAAKCMYANDRERFTEYNPGKAKREGRKVLLRLDWEEVKDQVMLDIVRAKFSQNEILKEKLLATGDAHLVEGNTWGDCYWGVCKGKGRNHLGIILMQVRKELQNV